MPFDDQGKFSWDGMKLAVTDGQKAAELVQYRQGIWWVIEARVRDDEGQLIGVLTTKTLISQNRNPELVVSRVKIDGHRFE